MKVETNFYKEKGVFTLPVIVITYSYEDRELVIDFVFACWAFSIIFAFK